MCGINECPWGLDQVFKDRGVFMGGSRFKLKWGFKREKKSWYKWKYKAMKFKLYTWHVLSGGDAIHNSCYVKTLDREVLSNKPGIHCLQNCLCRCNHQKQPLSDGRRWICKKRLVLGPNLFLTFWQCPLWRVNWWWMCNPITVAKIVKTS